MKWNIFFWGGSFDDGCNNNNSDSSATLFFSLSLRLFIWCWPDFWGPLSFSLDITVPRKHGFWLLQSRNFKTKQKHITTDGIYRSSYGQFSNGLRAKHTTPHTKRLPIVKWMPENRMKSFVWTHLDKCQFIYWHRMIYALDVCLCPHARALCVSYFRNFSLVFSTISTEFWEKGGDGERLRGGNGKKQQNLNALAIFIFWHYRSRIFYAGKYAWHTHNTHSERERDHIQCEIVNVFIRFPNF